jgi:hypothetical protein
MHKKAPPAINSGVITQGASRLKNSAPGNKISSLFNLFHF